MSSSIVQCSLSISIFLNAKTDFYLNCHGNRAVCWWTVFDMTLNSVMIDDADPRQRGRYTCSLLNYSDNLKHTIERRVSGWINVPLDIISLHADHFRDVFSRQSTARVLTTKLKTSNCLTYAQENVLKTVRHTDPTSEITRRTRRK